MNENISTMPKEAHPGESRFSLESGATGHPLYKELKSIINKSSGIPMRVKEELLLIEGIEYAFVYGSFAQGKELAASDVDIMIIGDPKTSLVAERLTVLGEKFGRELNFAIYTLKEFKAKKSDSDYMRKKRHRRI